MRSSSLRPAIVAGVTLAVAGTSLAPAFAADADVDDQLAAVKKATSKFQDEKAAIAAGYLKTDACTAGPDGVMGYHYVNPELMKAGGKDALKPPVMIYQPKDDGTRQLVAVEWFQPDADQDLSTDSDRPSMFGVPFDGPMEGHEPGMPRHYDLHAWIYLENPAGVFKMWNKDGTCGDAATPMPAGHDMGGSKDSDSESDDDAQVDAVPTGGAALGGGSGGSGGDVLWLMLGGGVVSLGGLYFIRRARLSS